MKTLHNKLGANPKNEIERAKRESFKEESQRLYQKAYVQVIVAIITGVLLGYFYPRLGISLKPLGDIFVNGIKMVIAPIVFTTIVCGIAGMSNLRRVANVGVKAVVYFEIVSTIALLLGWLAADLLHPGANFNANPSVLDSASVAGYANAAQSQTITGFLVGIVPGNIVLAFAKGDLLPVLLISVMFGIALNSLQERGKLVLETLDQFSKVFFVMVRYVTYLAPLAAFGATAYSVGAYGINSLGNFALLLATVAVVSVIFIVVVLGIALAFCGINLRQVLRYFREEILIVFGATSSETMIPRIMLKLETIGCSKDVVGLVIPAGYSFNMDGTAIYMSLGVLFIAQAMNIDLTLMQQGTILLAMLVTSKGAAGVAGGGFITLAATLSVGDLVPVSGLALLIGIDRFMSQIRAATNMTGNVIAAIVVARWTGALDMETARAELGRSSRATANHEARPLA